MPTPVFIDTNVLLYAASDGRSDPEKKRLALELLRTRAWVLSIQVVQEFHVNATRKAALGIGSEKAAEMLDGLLARANTGVDASLFRSAVVLQSRHSLSYWDAAVVAAAKRTGCRILFSEDMASGEDYDGVLVLNPFADGGRWLREGHPRAGEPG
jgi:predicted nucleic acid-binding protein